MIRTKFLPISSSLLLFVSASALSGPGLLEEMRPYLIAQPHPELAAMNSLEVAVMRSGAIADTNDSLWKDLKTKVEQKLKQAGLKIPDSTYPGRRIMPSSTPQLNIRIDALKLEDTQQNVFLIRTALARPVHIAIPDPATRQFKPGPILKTSVWATTSPMTSAPTKDAPAKVCQAALQLTEAFITAWTAANPPEKAGPNSNRTATTLEKPTERTAEAMRSGHKYVASKNSKVFHLPGCRSAKRISAGNLVGYESRKEAIKAGKRPCKLCRP